MHMETTGLDGGTLYEVPLVSIGSGNVTVPATGFNITCGPVPDGIDVPGMKFAYPPPLPVQIPDLPPYHPHAAWNFTDAADSLQLYSARMYYYTPIENIADYHSRAGYHFVCRCLDKLYVFLQHSPYHRFSQRSQVPYRTPSFHGWFQVLCYVLSMLPVLSYPSGLDRLSIAESYST